MHVVFVIGRHLAMEDSLDDVKKAARETLDKMPWPEGSMAGVVSLSTEARTEVGLSDSKGPALSAIGRIQLDAVNPFNVQYYDWVGAARTMLERARENAVSPIEVILVYSTGCPRGFEDYCNKQTAAAGKAQGAGMFVMGTCNPNARPFGFPLPTGHCSTLQKMSSKGLYHDLGQAGQAGKDLADLAAKGESLLLDKVTWTEVLAPGIQLVAGSGAPAPRIQGQKLSFLWEDALPGSTVTGSYRVKAPAIGQPPLRTKDSNIVILDSLGRAVPTLAVALRNLNVVDCDAVPPTPEPSATPVPTEPPTATPTALPTVAPTDTPLPSVTPVPTATATRTPQPSRLLLPLLMKQACQKSLAAADIALVLDASSSMNDASSGRPKIEAAKEAARRFLALLGPRDQAAVVAFHNVPLLEPLTSDRAHLAAAIDGIRTAPGTRIDRALVAAGEELAGPRARPGAVRVLILLTDGRTEAGSADAALAAALALRASGGLVFIIGLGDDVDAAFLQQLASDPARYLPAPSAKDLSAIYEGIARELPCPGGVTMGGAQ
jgi:Mg-chelatase subunit ChlD